MGYGNGKGLDRSVTEKVREKKTNRGTQPQGVRLPVLQRPDDRALDARDSPPHAVPHGGGADAAEPPQRDLLLGGRQILARPGEIREDKHGHDSHANGHDALHDEEPSPPPDAVHPFQIGHDGPRGEPAEDAADLGRRQEQRRPLAELARQVPAREEEHHARREARLERADQHPHREQLRVGLDGRDGAGHDAPEEHDGWEVERGASAGHDEARDGRPDDVADFLGGFC